MSKRISPTLGKAEEEAALVGVGPRIDARAAEAIARAFDSRNLAATTILEAWPQLVRGSLEEVRRGAGFAPDELRLILDAANGLWITPEILGQHVAMDVEDHVRLNGAAQKWEVDARVLLERIGRLTLFQRAALEIWCAEFWRSDQLNARDFERRHLALLTTASDAEIMERWSS